jgi:type IV secretory pathway VirB2 component (pilin)
VSRPSIRTLILAALVLTLLVADPAFAQIAGGGGGGGLMQQIIQWFVTNIVQGLVMGAVLFIGALLLFGRHSLAGVMVVIVGALVIANYQTIAGLFGIGG